MIFFTNSTEATKGPALFGDSSQELGRAEKDKKRQMEEQKKSTGSGNYDLAMPGLVNKSLSDELS